MILAFGYKHGGPPRGVKKVFDVRDLTHDTHREDFLQRESEIREYVRAHPGEDVAVGCDQGQHRSVTIVRSVATALHRGYHFRDAHKKSVK